MSKFVTKSDDAIFPQLAIVTDPQAMKEIFRREFAVFGDGRLELENVAVTEVRYEPEKKCHVCYRLRVKNLATGKTKRPVCFAAVERRGEGAAKFAAAARDVQFQPRLLPALHFFAELNMIVWAYPNDPKLKQLHQVARKDCLLKILNTHWDDLGAPPEANLQGVRIRRIKYVPRDRCTLRHRLLFAGAKKMVLYSKTLNRKTSGELIFRTMQALWNSPVCQTGEFLIPEPLFFVRELNTIFVRGLQGINADDHLVELDLDQVAKQIGVGLAGMQQCHIEGIPHSTADEVLAQVVEAEAILGKFDAAYLPRVATLAAALREKYERLPLLPPALIHSAFRLSQFLVVDGKLALIDFDDFVLGNPIADVASFVAHLLYLPLKGELTTAQSRSAIRRFCATYAARAPWGLPHEVLIWQTAAQLLGKQAKKCIRLAKDNHAEKVERLLDLATTILNGTEKLV